MSERIENVDVMNYELLASRKNPFEGLSSSEATRLYVYMTKVRDPVLNGDEIYRKYGFLPDGGGLNIFQSVEIAVDILAEICANPGLADAKPSRWIDRYLCEGVRLIEGDEREAFMKELESDVGFSHTCNGYEIIAVKGKLDPESETWLKVDKEILTNLTEGEMLLHAEWPMCFHWLRGKLYELGIDTDEAGVRYVCEEEVNKLPSDCRAVRLSSLYDVLATLVELSEREVSDDVWEQMDVYEESQGL